MTADPNDREAVEKVARQHRIGDMYQVPWSPRPHRLEAITPRYCQLHGEFIGVDLKLRKRRGSETRPWGCISVVDAGTSGIHRLNQEPTP